MDLEILKIASNTENNKVLTDSTCISKHKNPICGDEMQISLKIKNDKISDFGYQCKSCIYCQASVSLLSRKVKNKLLQSVSMVCFAMCFIMFLAAWRRRRERAP